MTHPTVKFRIDPSKDLRTLRAFVKDAKYDGGRSLQWGIFRRHPLLKPLLINPSRLPLTAIRKYINSTNVEQRSRQRQASKKIEKEWKLKKKSFFRLSDELFCRARWPKGKYIAYFTIWTMFPRFLKDKTFQVPFGHKKKGYVSVIIAHELLHFIFYKHFYRWHPEYRRPRYNYFIWNVSEIFNALVQNSTSWTRVFKQKTMAYPEHARIVRKLHRELSQKKLTAEALTERILKEVKKEPKFRKS
jgi:hypothetical protein